MLIPVLDPLYADYRKRVRDLLLYQGVQRFQAGRLVSNFSELVHQGYMDTLPPSVVVHTIVHDRNFMKMLTAPNPVARPAKTMNYRGYRLEGRIVPIPGIDAESVHYPESWRVDISKKVPVGRVDKQTYYEIHVKRDVAFSNAKALVDRLYYRDQNPVDPSISVALTVASTVATAVGYWYWRWGQWSPWGFRPAERSYLGVNYGVLKSSSVGWEWYADVPGPCDSGRVGNLACGARFASGQEADAAARIWIDSYTQNGGSVPGSDPYYSPSSPAAVVAKTSLAVVLSGALAFAATRRITRE